MPRLSQPDRQPEPRRSLHHPQLPLAIPRKGREHNTWKPAPVLFSRVAQLVRLLQLLHLSERNQLEGRLETAQRVCCHSARRFLYPYLLYLSDIPVGAVSLFDTK